MHCPDCNSDCIILWDDGYLCCSCGCEFEHNEKHWEETLNPEEE